MSDSHLTAEGSSAIRVLKFGGTSVATQESRAASVMKVLSAREQGCSPVVVVSAIGRRGAPYATDTLIGLLTEVDPSVEPDPRELDIMIACGEIMSAAIFAQTLKTFGCPAQVFRGGQAGIRTDSVHGNARIVGINPVSILESIKKGYVPVVCGFQGVYVPGTGAPGGELTTLGRGGSDTTASALGAALKAEAIEIYTDVDGVKSADPDYVRGAPTLRKVTYDEVAEIAHLGAKVVHPRAAEIAMHFQIPLWVKNTFTDDEGTEVVAGEKFPGRRVTGVTHSGKLVYMQFNLASVAEKDRIAIEGLIYEELSRCGISLYMLNLGPASTGFAVPRDQYQTVKDLFDGLVVPAGNGSGQRMYIFQVGAEASNEVETQAKLLGKFCEVVRVAASLTEGCTMVSLVGHDYMQQPGLFLNVLSTLGQSQINVLQTADSDFSLSVLIPESDTRRAVSLLHDRFGLHELE